MTIDNALAVHENLWAAVYSEAGTFGPERGTDTIQGNVLVRKTDGVTLRNLNITGDLLLSKDIGEGKAALDNVTVEGRTTVAGGGENSIYVNNSKLNTVIVSKKNGNVRIVSSGKTTMELVRLTGNITIILSGNFTSVQIDVPGAILVLESGTIEI